MSVDLYLPSLVSWSGVVQGTHLISPRGQIAQIAMNRGKRLLDITSVKWNPDSCLRTRWAGGHSAGGSDIPAGIGRDRGLAWKHTPCGGEIVDSFCGVQDS